MDDALKGMINSINETAETFAKLRDDGKESVLKLAANAPESKEKNILLQCLKDSESGNLTPESFMNIISNLNSK